MIPVRIYRVLIVLFGISLLVAGVDTALSTLGLRGVALTVIGGLFAGGVVFLMAMEGGRTLRFCAKGLTDDVDHGHISTLLKKIHCIELDLRVSIIKSDRVFAVSVSEGRSHRIFLSKRLLDEFSSAALKGVLAHECGHIRSGHPTKQAVLLGLVAGVKMAIGVPLLSTIIILLAYLWMLREWEFIADKEASKMTGSLSLRRAFEEYLRITNDHEVVSPLSEIFSGHPSFARRLTRIGEGIRRPKEANIDSSQKVN